MLNGRSPQSLIEQRRRLGLKLSLSPEQLDQAAEPTPSDVMVARVAWMSAAPSHYLDLLDAPEARIGDQERARQRPIGFS